MSKYDLLWEYVGRRTEPSFVLTFEDIRRISGVEPDHSFLKYKKELETLCRYRVGKISIKEKTVAFVGTDASLFGAGSRGAGLGALTDTEKDT